MANDLDQYIPNSAPEVGDEGDVARYKQTLSESRESADAGVRQSMFVASTTTPDRAAEAVRIAKETNLPYEIVDRTFDESKKIAVQNKTNYEKLISENPKLSEWLKDPTKASVSSDDLENLGRTENAVKEYTFFQSSVRSLNVGLSKFNSGVAKLPAFAHGALYGLQNLAVESMGREDLVVKTPDWLINNPIANFYDKQAQLNHIPELEQSITEEIGNGNYSKAGRAMFMQLVSNAPTQAALIASHLTGLGTVGLVGAGALSGAQTYDESLESGASSGQSALNAVIGGTIESTFEKIGTFGILGKWENAIAKQYGKQTAKEVIKDFSKTMLYSALGEGNEEALTSIAQDYTEYVTGVNPDFDFKKSVQRAADAGLIGAGSGFAMTGPSAIGSGVARQQQIKEAAMARDFYISLGDSALATKTRERVPEFHREFIDEVTKDGPVNKIYIPVEAFETYFQGKGIPPSKAAQDVGATTAFEEAKTTGADIEVPLAQWVEKVVGTEHYSGLANEIKFSPEALTASQAIAEKQRATTELESADQGAVADEATKQEQIKSVVQNIEVQLREAGLNPKQAEVMRGIAVLAQREGIDPNQFYESLGLKIGRGTEGEGVTFNQENTNPQSPLGFVSPVQTEISKMDFKAMPAKDLANRITNLPGIKKEELETLGLKEWLESTDGKVTKEQVQEFINSNGLQVEQVVLSSDYKAPPKKLKQTKEGDVFIDDVSFSVSEVEPDEDQYANEADYYLDDSEIFDEQKEEELSTLKEEVEEEVRKENPEFTDEQVEAEVEKITSEKSWIDNANGAIRNLLYDSAYDMAVESVNENNDVTEVTEDNTGYMLRWSRNSGTQEVIDRAGRFVEEIPYDVKIRDSAQAQSALTDWLVENGKVFTDRTIPEDKVQWSAAVSNAIEGNAREVYFLDDVDGVQLELLKSDGTWTIETPSNAVEFEAEGLPEAKAEAVAWLKTQGIVTDKVVEVPAAPAAPVDVNAPTGKAKFASYKVEGGENYREILLTLPKAGPDKFVYASHFSQPNVVAHVRLTDRVDSQGRKTLFVEELQSDWHQQGRERGYKGDALDPKAAEKISALKTQVEELVVEINEASIVKMEIESKIEKFEEDSGIEDVKNSLATYAKKYMNRNFHLVPGEGAHAALFAGEKDYESKGISKENYAKIFKSKTVKGFVSKIKSSESELKALRSDLLKAREAQERLEEQQSEIESEIGSLEGNPVPDAPFKNTEAWAGLAMKRMLRLAVEEGYEALAWSPAEVHVDRWGTDSISWVRDGDGWLVGSVEQVGGRADGVNIEELARERGELLKADGVRVTNQTELRKVIGETLSRERNDRSLDSLTDSLWLKMQTEESGVKAPRKEGMEFFYDNVIPRKVIPDILKKIDKTAKIQVTEIGTRPVADTDINTYRIYDSRAGSVFEAESEQNAKDLAENNDHFQLLEPGVAAPTDKTKMKVLEVPITDQMKTKILEGLTLFQKDGNDPRGMIRFGKNGINLDVLSTANASTFFHETGHLYLEVLGRLAAMEGATQQTKDDMQAVLKWLEVDSVDKIGVEQHEKFARGFERYLGEGKAPSPALKKMFNRFKLWILSVYERLDALNVELTDEVRDVMGRLLTSETEINRAQDEMGYNDLTFTDPKLRMNEVTLKKYEAARDAAKQAAEDDLTRRLMRDFERKQTERYKLLIGEVREQVEEQVNQTNTYNAISILQKGERADGTPAQQLKLDRGSLDKTTTSKMPRGIFSKDAGVSPAVAADLLGFESASELIEALTNAPKKADLIKQKTKERMAELYPDLVQPQMVSEEAIKAVHNDKRAQMLRMELEYLAANEMPVLKDVIRRVNKKPPSEKQVREQAEAIIGTKVVSEIKPYIYQRAEIKARKEAGEALARGDIDKAFELKQRELLNFELYRAATTAKENVESNIKGFKRFFKKDADLAKSKDIDIVNAGRALLADYGLAKPTEKTADEYLKHLKQYDMDTFNVVNALMESALEGAGDYKQVSYNDFADLADSVNNLWDLAGETQKLTVYGKRVDRAKAIEELNARLSEISETKVKPGYEKAITTSEKTTQMFLGVAAGLARVEHWVNAVDGGPVGAFRDYIWAPISEGTTKYRNEKTRVMKEYLALLKANKALFNKEPINAPELSYQFKNTAELMMAVLHSGNGSNLNKLLRGRPKWGTMNEDGTVSTDKWDAFVARMQKEGKLTKAHYELAQSIWDLMETLKPGAQKAHKSMYGYYFNEITADAIVTPFGNFKGGYIPAKVDLNTNESSKIKAEREQFEKTNNSFQFPTTGRGFTKARVDKFAAPLTLEMSLLGGHIDAVMRFTHIEPAVKEVNRIVTDTGFRDALSNLNSEAASEMLVPWLKRAASQQVVLPSESKMGKVLNAGASYLRRTVAMQIMFGNFVNTFEQFTGLIVAASKVKPKYLRNATASYIKNFKQMSEKISEKSEFMRSIQGENLYEAQEGIKQIIVNPTTFEKAQDFASRHTYVLQSFTQNIVNTVVWTGAYDQSIAEGYQDAEAIRQADAAVRMTQGSQNAEDISRYETGQPWERLFKQFAGYFNMLANLNASELQSISREVGLKKGAGKMFYVYMVSIMIPAMISMSLRRMMAGDFDEDDDDEYLDDALAVFFGSQLQTLTAMAPGVGQLATATYNRFNKQMYDDRLSLSPAVSVLESMVSIPAQVYKAIEEEAVNKRLVKDALLALGVATGTPTGALGRPVGYLMDVSEGEANPTGPIDFTRGILSGKKGDN